MKQIIFPKNCVEKVICWIMYGLHIWRFPKTEWEKYAEKGIQPPSWDVDIGVEDEFGDSTVILPEELSR